MGGAFFAAKAGPAASAPATMAPARASFNALRRNQRLGVAPAMSLCASGDGCPSKEP